MKNLDYGIIGNCKSAALVDKSGSIEWCCLPTFDSSSIFAKILDENKGGSFEIIVSEQYEIIQKYVHRTNILATSYTNGDDSFEIFDFMPRYMNDNDKFYSPPDIIRHIKVKSGKPKFKVLYNPKLEYAKSPTKTVLKNRYIKSFTSNGTYDSIYLYTNLNKEDVAKGREIELSEDAFFLLSYNQKILEQSVERSYLKLQRTKVYWLNWTERTSDFSTYTELINRSALVLKLLSYDKTGAILAAITTSLPETLGEIRNWDYRFCWLRDASMVIKTMSRLGHDQITQRYLKFIIDIIPDKDEKIQIMYGIDGQKKLTEHILEHLDGYEDSSPVRIGNAAYKQKQHDIYGILMDVIYQQFSIFETTLENGEELWTITRSIVRSVEKNWQKPDRGIWEIRTEQRHFTFSKVLCWVAVDRGIKVAKLLAMNGYIETWSKLAKKIKLDILEKAWNEEIQAFTQSYGSKDLDASTLLMEEYGFINAKDPKFVSTVKTTQKDLSQDGLMYRYKNRDDFGKPTSSFTICTFWLIHSLFKIGEKKEAQELFDKVLSYTNHLGLLSEDIDFKTKRLLGNFPQAYSHLALINTAIELGSGEVTNDGKLKDAMSK